MTARLEISELKLDSNFEYLLDASKSYDQDEDYGGKIVKYRFTINNTKEIVTSKSAIPVIFPGKGNYSISVVVEDNDHSQSEAVTLPPFSITG